MDYAAWVHDILRDTCCTNPLNGICLFIVLRWDGRMRPRLPRTPLGVHFEQIVLLPRLRLPWMFMFMFCHCSYGRSASEPDSSRIIHLPESTSLFSIARMPNLQFIFDYSISYLGHHFLSTHFIRFGQYFSIIRVIIQTLHTCLCYLLFTFIILKSANSENQPLWTGSLTPLGYIVFCKLRYFSRLANRFL